MSILAQHGYGKSDKIEQGIEDGSIQGVIVSPRDERPENLAALLANTPNDLERLVDPQFYAGTVVNPRVGKLPQYNHYRANLTPASFGPVAIREFVQETLAWQDNLNVSAVVSPTVLVDAHTSRWAQIAMTLAQETINQHQADKPLLISLVIAEEALREVQLVDGWLNEITQMDVDGFYLVIRRLSEAYRQQYEPDILTSLLRVCYSLAEINEYRVFVGYSDLVSLLLHAVGVTGTGAGWFSSLRQFGLRRFQQVTGGSQPRPRYTSRPLLNSIYVNELDAIYSSGLISNVLSGTDYDDRFTMNTNPENVGWPPRDAALHHWSALHTMVQAVSGATASGRLTSVRSQIVQALALYAQVGQFLPFQPDTSASHLHQWLDALDRFRSDAAV